MSWNGSTGGERAANTYAANEQKRRAHQEKMGDVNWRRRMQADFDARNQRNKQAVFDLEKQEARRENRPPRIWSPEQVPDLPLPSELLEPEVQPTDLRWLKWVAIAFGLWFPVAFVQYLVSGLPGIISIPILAGVVLTEVWVVLRYLAKGDPDKLEKAEKWNPVNVTKKSATWVKGKAAARQDKPPVVQFNQRPDADRTE